MKQPTEIQLMKIETQLDRIQRDARVALGEVRKILEYHKHHRQKTIDGWMDRPKWKKHQADWRNHIEKEEDLMLNIEEAIAQEHKIDD